MAVAHGLRVGIIGGSGTLGSTMGFLLALQDFVAEVVLIDLDENRMRAHVMDMEQAVVPVSGARVTLGRYEDLARCGIVIMTASVGAQQETDRLQFLKANSRIVESVAGELVKHCADAILINATNPADVFNYLFWRLTGLPRQRLIGFSPNDAIRFRWAIGKVLDVSAKEVDALVIGEHGPDQVLLFSTIKVDGQHAEVTEAQRAEISNLVYSWFGTYTGLKSGRTSGWTSAVSALRLVQRIARDSSSLPPIALSVIPDGEYGLRDVSVGLPVLLGPRGVESIVSIDLTGEEAAGLHKAVAKIRAIQESVLAECRGAE